MTTTNLGLSDNLDPEKLKKNKFKKIVKTIGQGTFGKVKMGIHIPTQQKVAIKILDKAKIKDNTDIERITREINILKILRHNNIVQLYDTVTSNRHIYLVMEYVEGGDLYEYINEKQRLDENKACALYQQLIAAIEYNHKLRIVHRDIKPENILLDSKHEIIKLVDFGLSNQYEVGEFVITPCGSPCYAAPEMISGNSYDGMMSDIWSSGVVLFCMLCGYLPFDDNNIKELYKKISEANFKIPNLISAPAKDLISNILKVDSNTRYKFEQIKRHKWFNLNKISLDKGIMLVSDYLDLENKEIKVKINKKVVEQVKDLKYFKDNVKITTQSIIEYIVENCHNNVTTSYYLLLEKYKSSKTSAGGNNAVTEQSLKENNSTESIRNLKPVKSPRNKDNLNKNDLIINNLSTFNSKINNVQNNKRNKDLSDVKDEYSENTKINKNMRNKLYELNKLNSIQAKAYLGSDPNKSVNVVVINNILTDLNSKKEKPNNNSVDDKLKNKKIVNYNSNNLSRINRRNFNLSIKIGKDELCKTLNEKLNLNSTFNTKKSNSIDNKVGKIKMSSANTHNSQTTQTTHSVASKAKTKTITPFGKYLNISKKINLNSKNISLIESRIENKSNYSISNDKNINVTKILQSPTTNLPKNSIDLVSNKNKNKSRVNNYFLPETDKTTILKDNDYSNRISSSNRKIEKNSLKNLSNNKSNNNKYIFVSPENSFSNLNYSGDPDKLNKKSVIDKKKIKEKLSEKINMEKNNSIVPSRVPSEPHNNNNHNIIKRTNFLNYQCFNKNLFKNKIEKKAINFNTLNKINFADKSNNSNANKQKNLESSLVLSNNNSNNHGLSSNKNYNHFKKLYDNVSFNYEHSSIFNKNENSLNISNVNELIKKENTWFKCLDLPKNENLSNKKINKIENPYNITSSAASKNNFNRYQLKDEKYSKYCKINTYEYKPGFLKSNVLLNDNKKNTSLPKNSNHNSDNKFNSMNTITNKLNINKSKLDDILKKNSEINESLLKSFKK